MNYWNKRDAEYYNEVFNSHHYYYENFFQYMLINQLKKLDLTSFLRQVVDLGGMLKESRKNFQM